MTRVCGEIKVPGDKSISHRALIFASLADGVSTIRNFLAADDCLATMHAMQAMGADIVLDGTTLTVRGMGMGGLKCPTQVLDVRNSGTSARLLLGVLAAQDFEVQITGDDSLRRRPMKRVIEPLEKMGAKFTISSGDVLPVRVLRKDRPLEGIHYRTPLASAQVKSAILLAGMYAEGSTSVEESRGSRDHTENMMTYLGLPIKREALTTTIEKVTKIPAFQCDVPGDISSAAFFIVLTLLVPDSELVLKNVGLNPTRTGFLNVLQRMGADIQILNQNMDSFEPFGDLLVKSSFLTGTDILAEEIPSLIDEIPILAVAAAKAEGLSRIQGAEDLRQKESDRLQALAFNLKNMGVNVLEKKDGLEIKGQKDFASAHVRSFGDHRIAMAMEIAKKTVQNEIQIDNTDCVNISFPQFYELLRDVLE